MSDSRPSEPPGVAADDSLNPANRGGPHDDPGPASDSVRQHSERKSNAPGSSTFGDLEDGIGHLFVSMERGLLNMIDAHKAQSVGIELTTAEIAQPDAAAANNKSGSSDAVPVQQRPKPRVGSSYDDVLKPIRWSRVVVAIAGVLVLAVLYFVANLAHVWIVAGVDQTQPADAIVVLGAAQFDGKPSRVFAGRLDRSFELWEQDFAPLIVTTGASQQGDRFTEGLSGYLYLRERGVPDANLIVIIDGVDTWEQMAATAAQLFERDLNTALMVSDPYHSLRLTAIAEEVGLEVFVAPTETDSSARDYWREATAVSVGRILGYRRISAFGD